MHNLSPPMARAIVLLVLFYSCSSAASSHSCGHLLERAQPGATIGNSTTTLSTPSNWLVQQYNNPSEVLSVLLLIGGDIVQKAIAQLVGRWTVTPAAFSFGWVSYAFMAVSSALGDGTLMPLPDIPCRVINLKTGNYRQNESWVIGRLLRDLELEFELPASHRRPVIRILTTAGVAANPEGDKCWWSFVFFIPAQLLLAAGPLIAPRRNWTVLMVTAVGSLLATLTSSLPQWRKEKFNCRTNSKETYVLTRGNGHPHIFVIQNGATYYPNPKDQSKKSGISVNLEDLAVAYPATTHSARIAVFFLALLWVFLLITVAGLKQDAWYLLGVGSLGTIHNIFVANHKRSPRASGVPLKRLDNGTKASNDKSGDGPISVQGYACVEIGHPRQDSSLSTMNVLKLAEQNYAGLGLLLLKIFFPGDVDQQEVEFWRKQRESLSERRLGLKARLDSKTESLAVPPIKRRPPFFSRTSSSISWRGLTGKTSHRQDVDPEKGKNSTKQAARESAQRKVTGGSTSAKTVTSDRIATHDFGQQTTGISAEITPQSTQQSPTWPSPRRSHESSILALTEIPESDAAAGHEEYSSVIRPADFFHNIPLHPIISVPEPADDHKVVNNVANGQDVSAGAAGTTTQRIVPPRPQSYTGPLNRSPRPSRVPALRTQTGYASSGADPIPSLTRRAKTFTFPTNSI
jgi:hypothetical protein